jgi:mycofactocin precursor
MEHPNSDVEKASVEDDLVIEDLVEDVSIDGMCGVY